MVSYTFIKTCTIPDINNKIILSNNKKYKFLGKKHIEEIINNIIDLPENYYIYNKNITNNKFDPECVIPDDENKITISTGKKVKFMSAKHRNEIINENMKMVEGYIFKTSIVKIKTEKIKTEKKINTPVVIDLSEEEIINTIIENKEIINTIVQNEIKNSIIEVNNYCIKLTEEEINNRFLSDDSDSEEEEKVVKKVKKEKK